MMIMTRIILSICLAIFLIGCKSEVAQKGGKKALKTYTVAKKTLTTTLHFSDYVRPIRSVSVVSPADGRVTETNIVFGSTVEKGKVLLKVTADKIAEEYYTAVSTYLRAKDTFDLNRVRFAGTSDLWTAGLTPRNTYMQEKSQLDTSRIALIQAAKKLEEILQKTKGVSLEDIKKIDVSDEKAVSKALELGFETAEVIAEVSGVLLEPSKTQSGDSDPKNVLAVGSEIKKGQLLALIGDVSGITLNIKIAEIDLDKIKVGQEVSISSVVFPNITLKGRVQSVNFQASNTGGAVGGLPTFPGVVEVTSLAPEVKDLVRVGMSATAAIDIKREGLLMVPIDAVFQEKGKSLVKRLEGEKVVEVPVTTGETSYNDVVITSGLKEGDKIQYREKEQVLVNH